MFLACSSDDPASMKEWLGSQGMSVSYESEYFEADIAVKDAVAGFDSSASMVSGFAALGSANGVEHTLYFGLIARASSEKKTWTLRMDKVFYEKNPLPGKEFSAEFSWLAEKIKPDSLEADSSWLKLGKAWDGAANATLSWQADSSFTMELPKEFLAAYPKQDSIIMLAGLKLENGAVLRIAPPPALGSDIEGLIRVAQRSRPLEACGTCLYAGVKDSIVISFDMNGKPNKTVVFAQLVLPKTGEMESEFGHPIPLLVYNEDYRVDTAYAQESGHPNLLWKGKNDSKNDSIRLQVTRGLRNDSMSFALRFGNPMLKPNSLYFYNTASDTVFAPRPDYAKYDFAALKGKDAKLRLWLADYGEQR